MKKAKLTPKITDSIYILPNLLTTGNLFFGYYSVLSSIKGDFVSAALCILLAAVFDILDGSVARLTKASSSFGIQYDSLCDLISFGIAPVLLMYQYSLFSLGRVAFAVCFIYLACGALRLARFNVLTSEKSLHHFIGLPIPIPACLLACFVAMVENLKEHEGSDMMWGLSSLHSFLTSQNVLQYLFVILALFLSFLMVSNILYQSHKSLNIKGISSFRLTVVVVLLLSLLLYRPALIGFLFFFIYVLSAPIEYLLGWREAWDEDDI